MINISLISRHGTSARKMAFSYPLSHYLTTHRPVNNYNKLKILQVGSDLLRRKWQVTILTFKIYVAAWPSSDTQLWVMFTIRTVRKLRTAACATLTLGLGLELDLEIYFSLFADSVYTMKTLAGSFHVQWHFHNGPPREWRWVSSSASCPTAQRNHLISDWLFNDVLVEWRDVSAILLFFISSNEDMSSE